MKNTRPTTAPAPAGVAPIQLDLLEQLPLEALYDLAAERLLAMRAQHPFTWRDAERLAVVRRLDREFGLRDAAFTVLSEQTGYSSPLGIFFEIEPRLRPEEVEHADAIAMAAFARSQPNRLIAATDTGIVKMRCLLQDHARWAVVLTAQPHPE
jgi:hypothetical protein